MDIPKKYIHDKLILLLITANAFLALIITIVVALRFDPNRASGYFVQYRANLGLNAYKTGGYVELASFAVFAILIAAFHMLLSVRVYRLGRHLSVAILGFGTVLLVLAMVVSNALLVLTH